MTSPKPRIGRPPLPAGKAHVGRALSVKLSGDEWADLDRLCEIAHCTRGVAVRRALAHLLAALEAAEGRRRR